jgi:hypothetical protein
MDRVVRAEYKYNGLVLTCNPSTVHRLHALLRVELAVAVPIPDGVPVAYVTVRVDVPPASARLGWLSIAAFAIGMAVNLVVFVAGWVAVVGWLSR